MSFRKIKTSPQRASARCARRAGFTLIEMLIVIAIIGILAAILFPVFAKARAAAQRTTCQFNMKSLGQAFQLYLQDNNGRYPGAGQYQQWGGGIKGSGLATPMLKNTGHWMTGGDKGGNPKNYGATGPGLAANASPFDYTEGTAAMPDKAGLFPYAKSTAIYMCPSTDDAEEKGLSYSMNCALAGVKESKISAPTEMILLVDEGKSLNDGYFWAVSNASATDLLTTAHLGGGNLLFADGHVKFFGFDQFPLDNSTLGLKNKTDMTANPRFHDRGLGSIKGSSYPSDFSAAKTDTCSEAAVAGP